MNRSGAKSEVCLEVKYKNQKQAIQLEELKLKMKNFIFSYNMSFHEMQLSTKRKLHSRKIKKLR